MRKQFVECACRKTAERRCPWAAKVMKVEGGHMAFECVEEYRRHKKQK